MIMAKQIMRKFCLCSEEHSDHRAPLMESPVIDWDFPKEENYVNFTFHPLWDHYPSIVPPNPERLPSLPFNETCQFDTSWDPEYPKVDVWKENGVAEIDYQDATLFLHDCPHCIGRKLCTLCVASQEFDEFVTLHDTVGYRAIRHLRRVARHFLDVALKVRTMDERTRSLVRKVARNNFYARWLETVSKETRMAYTGKFSEVWFFFKYLRSGKAQEMFSAHYGEKCTKPYCTRDNLCLDCQAKEEHERERPWDMFKDGSRGGIIGTVMDFFHRAGNFCKTTMDRFIDSIRKIIGKCFSWISSIIDTVFEKVIVRLRDSILRIFTADVPDTLRKHWGKLLAILVVCMLVDIGLCGENFFISLLKFTLTLGVALPLGSALLDIPYAIAGMDRTQMWRDGLDFWNDGVLPNDQKIAEIQRQDLVSKVWADKPEPPPVYEGLPLYDSVETQTENPPSYSPSSGVDPGVLSAALEAVGPYEPHYVDETPSSAASEFSAHGPIDYMTVTERIAVETCKLLCKSPVFCSLVLADISVAVRSLVHEMRNRGLDFDRTTIETIYHTMQIMRPIAQQGCTGPMETARVKLVSERLAAIELCEDYHAHNPLDAIGTIVSLCTAFFGPSVVGSSRCYTFLKTLALACTAGTALGTMSSRIMFLLPVGVRSYLNYIISDDSGKAKQEVDDWSVLALALLKVSKVPAVLASADFAQHLAKCIENGRHFVRDNRLTADTRALFVPIYLQLVRIQSTLVQIQQNGRDRSKPFSFHLSGPPGVGKSFMMRTLCQDVFGVTEHDFWNRPIGGEFWSGYVNQKVVVYDEFLIGDDQPTLNMMGREYLGLVSTGQFMPEFASMDSPSVGIKGTAVAPEIVCTINNHPYVRVEGLENEALWRRREFVIECRFRQNALRKQNGDVDFKQYTAQQIRDFAWMEFVVSPNQRPFVRQQQVAVSYPILVRFMKFRYETFKNLQASLVGDVDPSIDASAMIIDAIRDVQNIPSGELDLPTIIGGFVAHGPPEDEGLDYVSAESHDVSGISSPEIYGADPTVEPPVMATPLEITEESHGWIQPGVERTNEEDQHIAQLADQNGASLEDCARQILSEDMTPHDHQVALGVMQRLGYDLEPTPPFVTPTPSEAPGSIQEFEEVPQVSVPTSGARSRNGSRRRPIPRPRRITRESELAMFDRMYLYFQEVESGQRVIEQKIGKQQRGEDAELAREVQNLGGEMADFADEMALPESETWEMVTEFVQDESEMLKLKWRDYDPLSYIAEYASIYVNRNKPRSYWWVAIIGVAVLSVGALFLARKFLGYTKEELTFAHSPRPHSDKKKPAHRRNLRRTVGFQAHMEQAYCTLISGTMEVRCSGLGSGWFMTYYHGLDHLIKKSDNIYISDGVSTMLVDFDSIQIVTDRANDFVVFHIPSSKNRPSCRNIVNRFISDEDLSKCESFSVIMEKKEGIAYGTGKVMSGRAYRTESGEEYRHETALMTNIKSAYGDCGYLVRVSSGPYEGKYIGMNVAGTGAGAFSARSISSIVTKEMLIEAIGKTEDFEVGDSEFQAHGGFRTIPCPSTEFVFLNRKTKFKRSSIGETLIDYGFKETKFPPVLSERDPRGPGIPPENVAMNIMKDLKTTNVDREYCRGLVEQMYHDHAYQMHYPIGFRELTFEEAVGGIPGILSSINTQTSPGYPLIFKRQKKGKKDFVWFNENGELGYTPYFRARVMEFLEAMKRGDKPNHVWMGYLKDELVKQSKIDSGRTRITYASSLIATVAFRMKFGFMIIAYQSNFGRSFSAAGMNQYSYDMQAMEQYLAEVGPTNRCVAGDYEAFDMRHNKIIRELCYEIMFGHLMQKAMRTENEINFFILHETACVFQIGCTRFVVDNLHCSGNFLTRVMNDWVNETYLRYSFDSLNPGKRFLSHVRVVGMGDDHVANSSPNCEFSGTMIKQVMEIDLGQHYTSDTKEEDPGTYRTFDDVTFCGAHPRMIQGAWSGALKKKTLENTLLYTKNNNLTIHEECIQMVELASQWDEDYYVWYQAGVQKALYEQGIDWNWLAYKPTQRMVAQRLASRGFDFVACDDDFDVPDEIQFFAHSMEPDKQMIKTSLEEPAKKEGITATRGLVSLHTSQLTCQDHIAKRTEGLEDATCESPMDMNYGVDSSIVRKQVQWTTTQGVNTHILEVENLPWDLLKLGNQDNLQNMPFNRFTFWHGDIELTFQINGTPFQQGKLVAYFMPLTNQSVNDFVNVQSAIHVKILPNRNTTARLRIPYRYPRTYMLTSSNDSLGSLHVMVYSPLRAKQQLSCTLTMYSSFPQSTFILPRPTSIFGDGKEDECEAFEAHGNTTSNTSYRYDRVGSVSGQMTSEVSGGNRTHAQVAMDNPSLCSGGFPVTQQFNGLCKSVGTETTTAMQCNPSATYMHSHRYLDQTESTIDFLCSRLGIICVSKIGNNTAVDDVILEIPMNSLFRVSGTYWSTGRPESYPICVAVLNHFHFWRADVVLTFEAIRNDYQTTRLRGVMAYGASSFAAKDKDIFYNEVMDFTAEKDTHTLIIPYNAVVEFLRTYDGVSSFPKTDYNLGIFALMVANELTVPKTTCVAEIEIMTSISFKNVGVACPRAIPYIPLAYDTYQRGDHSTRLVVQHNEPPKTKTEFGNDRVDDDDTFFFAHMQKGQVDLTAGQASDPIESGTGASGHDSAPPKAITDDCKPDYNESARTKHKKKFPYVIRDIYDLIRRARPYFEPGRRGHYAGWITEGRMTAVEYYMVKPTVPFMGIFAAWSGELRYRIYLGNENEIFNTVLFAPVPFISNDENNFMVPGVIQKKTAWEGISVGDDKQYLNRLKQSNIPIPSGAIEIPYSVSEDKSYIDVQIPFMTHFNFLWTEEDGDKINRDRQYLGKLIIIRGVPKATKQSTNFVEDANTIFVAGADSFRLGIFRPPVTCKPIQVANNRSTPVAKGLYRVYGFGFPLDKV